MTETVKKWRLSEFVKDGYLADLLRARLGALKGAELERAQEAVADLAASGLQGEFRRLARRYCLAIAEAVDPTRKPVTTPRIDRSLMKNKAVAARIDLELEGCTKEELDKANATVRRIRDGAQGVEILKANDGEERQVVHDPGPVCKQSGEHASSRCGFMKTAEAWSEFYCEAVRAAVEV